MSSIRGHGQRGASAQGFVGQPAKIYKNWAGLHLRQTVLYEMAGPEQTLMELRMSSLVPPQAVAELESRLDGRFRALPETARLALITAQVEGQISHDRLKQISAGHPADLTKLLGVQVRATCCSKVVRASSANKVSRHSAMRAGHHPRLECLRIKGLWRAGVFAFNQHRAQGILRALRSCSQRIT